MKKFFKKLSVFLSNLFFPEKIKCIFCGRDVPNFEDKPYCCDCEKSDIINNNSRCKVCDMEIFGSGDVCDLCKTKHKTFDRAKAPFKYSGRVRSLVLKFKNDGMKYLAEPMAQLMLEALDETMKDFDVVIPVPMTDRAIKQRGYNQSEILANAIARKTGKLLIKNALIKAKDTPAQKTLSFKERQKNLENVFKLKTYKDVKGKTILLIDDVMTTCATADACSRILKRHCKKVYILTFARNTISQDEKN